MYYFLRPGYKEMPRISKKKPTGARRRPAMRRRRPTSNVNRALQPVAQRYICKQKYSEVITTDAGGQFAFNMNSVFDPNRSGIGHQPYGFDTLASLYNRYRVISCGWRIQPNSVPGVANNVVAAFPANEIVSFTTMSEVRENPRVKYINASAGGSIPTLKGWISIPSLVGRTKAQYMSDDRYQAVVSANPAELAILNIITSSVASGVNGDAPAAATVHVLLEYTVEYFDIKHLSQS